MGIKFDASPEELDFYLKQNYNFGLLDFTESVCFIYDKYSIKKFKEEIKSAIKKINELKKAKEVVNKYINNYKYINNHEIEFTLKAIDSCIKQTKSYIEVAGSFYSYVKQEDKIMPANLLALVWTFAMRKGENICWKDISELYGWFSEQFEETDFRDIFIDAEEFPNKNTLPKKCKKYLRNKDYFKYYKLAHSIFSNCFRGSKRIRNFPEPFNMEVEMIRYRPVLGFHIQDMEKFNRNWKLQRENRKKPEKHKGRRATH